jgi:L-fucose isomerase-like protein
VLLRNCGSSSVYWAGRSIDPKVSLPRVGLLPNIHGKSGSAVHYETPGGGGPVTVARLFRSPEGFGLYYGLAEILDATPESAYPDPWPHTRLSFASDPRLIYKTTPGNHSSLTEGDFIKELEVFCRYTGITGVRCDSDEAMKQFLDQGGPTAIPPGPDRL